MNPAKRTQPPPLWDAERLAAPHAQADKALRVRRMFDAIAPTYELINTLFSAGRDRSWRRRAVGMANPTADDAVLDIACGTGDFARAFRCDRAGPRRVVGCDFSENMLALAAGRGVVGIQWVRGDALELPFADASFSIVSCAFGVRNLQNLDDGLRETYRVLRPGGRVVILEFGRIANPILRRMYELYSRHVMPWGASLISRDASGAYRYLPRSVLTFTSADEFRRRLGSVGFVSAKSAAMTLGVVCCHVALKNDGTKRTQNASDG